MTKAFRDKIIARQRNLDGIAQRPMKTNGSFIR